MKFARNWPSSLLLALLLSGCAPTITPRQIVDRVASFDGNEQNSGFIGFDADGNGILTSHAVERYELLIGVYGGRFSPKIQPGDGVTRMEDGFHEPLFKIDREHLVKFAIMNRWHREGK